ncbi:MAG: hypothetical protein KQH79_01085 [Bacteroidetes bacterium]|nr:hypothetical protein [Bacteroidota bacterium]
MSKKRTVSSLRVKLNRLRQLEESNSYQYQTLNDYAEYLNTIIDELNLTTVVQIQHLGPGQSIAIGSEPSNSEREKMNEIISKYSEVLTEINPSHGQSIINEFKEASSNIKRAVLGINLALLIACAGLFYRIGVNAGENEKDVLNNQNVEKTEEIKELQYKIDSLSIEIENEKNKVSQQSPNESIIQDKTE